ncbi:MAG: mandelate racemase/muconate lactonizing enzyme family protein [Armatimonadota bacterium]|nr:mandelate racemase/muconate lactonizing enzyme family protein [Armatimonadota bacterium]
MRVASVRAIPLRVTLDEPQRTGVATFTTLATNLVEVRSDTGLVGYGESLARYSPRVWAAIVEDLLAPLVIGADPFDTERLWMSMFRDLRSFSGHHRGMLVEGIAGIDIALWDLKARAVGLPLYALLGGATRTRLDAYASSVMQRDPAGMVADAASLAEQGFRAIKVKVGVGVAEDAATLAAIRRAVGEQVELMIDANGAYRAPEAIDLARRVEHLRIAWFEEPVVADDLEGYQRIRAATSIPLAAGEAEFSRYGVRELLSRQVIDVLQPDVARAGGISETQKMIVLADAHHVRYAPHVGFSAAVCVAATLHLAAAAPNFWTYECIYTPNPLREHLAREPVGGPRQMVDGQIPVPSGVGLGIELDPEVIRRFRVAC